MSRSSAQKAPISAARAYSAGVLASRDTPRQAYCRGWPRSPQSRAIWSNGVPELPGRPVRRSKWASRFSTSTGPASPRARSQRARPWKLPQAISWPPPSTTGRAPCSISSATRRPRRSWASSSRSPSHATSPASSRRARPCAGRPARNFRIPAGPPAAPTRPWLRATPASQAKPSSTASPARTWPAAASTMCARRRVSPCSALSSRAFQRLLSNCTAVMPPLPATR
ncbi:hypothetical protein D9M72_263720 [compost metagenome]